jgi:hypothetical protein
MNTSSANLIHNISECSLLIGREHLHASANEFVNFSPFLQFCLNPAKPPTNPAEPLVIGEVDKHGSFTATAEETALYRGGFDFERR